ncbi:hypothetical protein FO440_21780 [Mucilaginibacter corticis]|uniref:Uncharacterized protein n=1 Tax=Mucilaginibacter corticis TaxID=2597670 RepID=A0A556M9E2_9SPHI|nr:hypothetical protein [Mucilaginibacter corticis]TSJ36466.1 hypothetical protein FO440_21780 [Mucilaginibacter corticis]
MGYDKLMLTRLDHFRAVLGILPGTAEIAAELLILSAGSERGGWSYRHLDMPGETLYFIFRKAGYSDGLAAVWECVDRDLDKIMKEQLGSFA